LQYLGHPIANDPIYANPRVFESFEQVASARDEELISRLEMVGKSFSASTLADMPGSTMDNEGITPVFGLEQPTEKWSGEICEVCGAQLYVDPSPGELEIWLHAWKYSGLEPSKHEGGEDKPWSFQSEVPDWGREDWQGPVGIQALNDCQNSAVQSYESIDK